MTNGPWWDTLAIVLVALTCAGLVLRRVMALVAKGPSAGCGSCAKCGHGEATPEKPGP